MSNVPGLFFHVGKKARDLLYRDYSLQPPTHFKYQSLKWNFDLSCETPEILPGVTTRFSFLIPDSCKVEFRFLQDYVGLAAGVGVKSYQQRSFTGDGYNPVVNFSGILGSTFFSLGTDIAFDIATQTFDELRAGLSFNGPLLLASLILDDKLDSLRASCYHDFNPLTKSAIGAELDYSFSANSIATFTIGAQHAVFPFMLMKARANTEAKIGALIQLELMGKFLLAISGEVDCRSSSKISKVGLSASLMA